MKKVLLACAAGLSTSMMVEAMKKAALAKGLELEIWAEPVNSALHKVDQVDVVLLGPQVRYELAAFQKQAKETVVKVIDMKHYGIMNGMAVIESIMSDLG
ncbi:PTS system cellobiose-specific component IIB [Spiroplasma clarkii]|uniref:PTS system, cellobiose-specific IIB component n=1 Tax=Spiroplasma clarkii TaxID=2139 RepID=A0A1Y0KZZ3_9MOLU|nr:PTS sugar transporter subunit IIB [Spiroplasma clarkii]ARU91334.1 PTS system cellobiose-specific component IIB [Spiroplasma clarkii]ATX70757.1 PTS system, cellobiose-specific IIB component [Spiroplasma clarkii]